jgi:hypothetical protein
MENLVHRVFAVRKTRIFSVAIVAGLFVLAAAYFLATTRWNELSQGESRVWLAVLLSALIIAAHYLAKAWRWQRAAVEVDEEGLWLQRLGRESRTRWEEVAATRGRAFLERLDLIDAGGKPLLGINYKVELYDQLVDQVARRMPPVDLAGRLPLTFRLPLHYFLIWPAALAAAGIHLALKLPGILVPIVAILMVAAQARAAVLKMVAQPESLQLSTVLGRRIVLKREIGAFTIRRDRAFRSVRPQVFLQLKDGSSWMLHFSAADAISLKRILDAWLAA